MFTEPLLSYYPEGTPTGPQPLLSFFVLPLPVSNMRTAGREAWFTTSFGKRLSFLLSAGLSPADQLTTAWLNAKQWTSRELWFHSLAQFPNYIDFLKGSFLSRLSEPRSSELVTNLVFTQELTDRTAYHAWWRKQGRQLSKRDVGAASRCTMVSVFTPLGVCTGGPVCSSVLWAVHTIPAALG